MADALYSSTVRPVGAEPPSGKITFALLTSEAPALWQGRVFGSRDLLFGTPGVELDMVSRAGYGGATASFTHMLRTGLGEVFREVIAHPFNDQAAANWALSKQEDLLRLLLRCTSYPASKTMSTSNGERARVLKAALAAINDQPEDVITVADLCRIAKASERTLDYAFAERFGLSPAL